MSYRQVPNKCRCTQSSVQLSVPQLHHTQIKHFSVFILIQTCVSLASHCILYSTGLNPGMNTWALQQTQIIKGWSSLRPTTDTFMYIFMSRWTPLATGWILLRHIKRHGRNVLLFLLWNASFLLLPVCQLDSSLRQRRWCAIRFKLQARWHLNVMSLSKRPIAKVVVLLTTPWLPSY